MSSAFLDVSSDAPCLEAAAQEWIDDLAVEGLVTRAVGHNIRLCVRWLQAQGITDPSCVTTAHCKAYIRMRQETISAKTKQLLSEITVRHEAVTLKAFLRWCYRQGYIKSERMYAWKLPKAHKPIVYMPTLSEQRTALQAIHDKWTVDINPRSRFRSEKMRRLFVRRDQALAATLMSTGMRIGEATRLIVESYDKERREIRIDRTKTDDPRAVPVSDRLAGYLDAWLRVRPKSCATNYLFVTEYGSQIGPSAWGKQWQGYLTFARAQGHSLPRITLHSLRHSAATAMATANLRDAQDLLGHKNLSSTARYLHTTSDRVRATHAAVDPLSAIMINSRAKITRRKIA